MTYCSNCIHHSVCGNEGVDNIAMTFCSDKQTDGDLISRKLAEECCLNGWNKCYEEILEDIRKLPSAEKTDGDLITEIDKLPRIKVGNSNSPTVKYCIDERLLYEMLEEMKGE